MAKELAIARIIVEKNAKIQLRFYQNRESKPQTLRREMLELLFLLSLFVLTILACVIVVARFSKPAPKQVEITSDELVNFETMLLPLEFSASTHEELEEASAKFFHYYDALDMTTVQKRFFLYTLAKHPNVRSELVLQVLNDMSERNPSIAKELEASVKKGLDRRDLLSKMV